MAARSRTFVFPGGMVQVAAYDDDDEDRPGFYLELHNHTGAVSSERDDGTDVDEEQISSLA
ncbi:hypothetical protein IU500_07530 [Nocardia terpenica]|uniref:hypothetical protein n=1 Tax=Nocardia terpenica TaxID=455432 RepID=UPI0018946160|nr:hypothetical protein [Nocardia terpenica]MBF6060627.1 hypothetical protein [Nocardia terpenica]MBF6103887.1 hypothetical protein [Nocardia terpenica]MBF6111739.1 hypothetical protein [Nocardia terpenica]MBF6118108.1 hypothetical protein [Nocardia terpenica]MBF6156498.1 hypothetical protein [Nocardia terpenica]